MRAKHKIEAPSDWRASQAASSHARPSRSSATVQARAVLGRKPPPREDLDDRYEAALLSLGFPVSTLSRARRMASRSMRPLYEVLTVKFAVADHIMARATARVFGLEFRRGPDIDVDGERVASRVDAGLDIGRVVPIKRQGQGPVWVLGYSPAAMSVLLRVSRATTDRRYYPAIATRQALADAVGRCCGTDIAEHASRGLERRAPILSAVGGLVSWQQRALTATAAIVLIGAAMMPAATFVVTSLVLSSFFAGHTLLRAAAAFIGLWRLLRDRPAATAPRKRLSDEDLPRYTVLIPLHREAKLLPQIADVIASFDYPSGKLDVKLLLEASDRETVKAAHALRWPSHVTIFQVPDLGPKTKPKAMNAALPLATGDLVVVYDAEDRPHPGQLRVAAETFAALPHDVAILQAPLSFFNWRENWLARQFAIEYAVHFGFILPALERLRLPIPLGGTSNHIRLDVLRLVGGWDAFNVTEDADLGLRIQALGCRTRMIAGPTEEEAACHWWNWLRQRTRWQKGWIQTYGVHMRRPIELIRALGFFRFVGFQFMIGGLILSPVAHLVFVATVIGAASVGLAGTLFDTAAIRAVFVLSIFNLVAGYGVALALGLLAVADMKWTAARRSVLTMPVYWLGIAAAAFRAIVKLVTDPFEWEKTSHGVSGLVRPSGARR